MNTPLYLPANFGRPITILPPDPAAGVELEFGVPVNSIILPISVGFTYTAAAGGANREVTVAGFDGASHFCRSPSYQGIAPGTARRYEFVAGLNPHPTQAGFTIQSNGLSVLCYLRQLDSLVTQTTTIAALDQISSIIIRYLLWIQE